VAGATLPTLPDEPVQSLDHEVKFVFPAAGFAAARAILRGSCRSEEPYAASLVETIYFDGVGLESLAEKLGSDYRKTKIRLRWYDRSPAVWLEVKRRVGSRREKRRLPLPAEFFDGRELSRRSVDDPALHRVPAILAAADEASPATLQPALHLSYRRERFFEPASGLRLSLDSDIVALRFADWTAAVPGVRRSAGGRRSPVLVEVKGGRRDLPAALAALADLGGRRESFSKYSFCMLD
jgi:hypothetical protein